MEGSGRWEDAKVVWECAEVSGVCVVVCVGGGGGGDVCVSRDIVLSVWLWVGWWGGALVHCVPLACGQL